MPRAKLSFSGKYKAPFCPQALAANTSKVISNSLNTLSCSMKKYNDTFAKGYFRPKHCCVFANAHL